MSNTLEYVPDGNIATDHPPSPSVGCSSFLALAWHRRGLLFKVTVLGLLLGALVVLAVPKRYEATARLMPPDPQATSGMAMLGLMAGGMTGGTAGLANSILSGKTPSGQLVGILESRSVRDSLIDRFNLRQAYQTKFYAGARQRLARCTDLAEDHKTGIVSITVTDTDRNRARDLAQAYVEELNKTLSRVSTSSARRERIFLEERLTSVEKNLDADARDLSQFSSRNATLDPQAQGKATLEGAARLQEDLIASESELRGLETIYSENNTRVRARRARIGELKNQMRKLAGSREEAGDELKDGEIYPSIRQLPLLGVTYFDLSRRVKVQEAVYEALMKQYELAKVQEAKEVPAISVLDAPLVPEKKAYPPTVLFTLLSGCLAFVLGLGWIAAERELQRSGIAGIDSLLRAEAWQKLIPSLGLPADRYA